METGNAEPKKRGRWVSFYCYEEYWIEEDENEIVAEKPPETKPQKEAATAEANS